MLSLPNAKKAKLDDESSSSQFEAASSPVLPAKDDVHPLLQTFGFGKKIPIGFDDDLGKALYELGAEAICNGTIPLDLARTANMVHTTSSDVTFGTVLAPNIPALLSVTKPSPFGKGDQTVFDDSVRKGLELTADLFSIDHEDTLLEPIKQQVHEKLFPGMAQISFKRYKMAIYQEGGHFEFHRDTMHATNHQATLLIEVRSAHEGGSFVIDHDGKLFEKSFACSAEDAGKVDGKELTWIAFYTDAKHKVESVTSGVRIVIQYDVYVEVLKNEKDDKKDDKSDDKKDAYGELKDEQPLQLSTTTLDKKFSFPTISPVGLENVLYHLKDCVRGLGGCIVLPLYHFYTSTSIKAQYLKNADRQLLIGILSTGEYEVGLSPVIVDACGSMRTGFFKDMEYCMISAQLTDPMTIAYVKYDPVMKAFQTTPIEPTSPLNQMTKKTAMIITSRESARVLSCESFIEYTGNEAQPASYKYYHGVMVIRKK